MGGRRICFRDIALQTFKIIQYPSLLADSFFALCQQANNIRSPSCCMERLDYFFYENNAHERPQ